ncbi:MAG: 4Fe-4S dicluster domain-containing protein [candidate division Zixibacteria bacterium]|nr:4Fe-4S dicluster domain-containing protein [candidate division Zixibacteria bacterium]MDD5426449.1 4Fe-4S dicluster domain-containing protein [candidate division Zixibacteria bacterium]
MSVAILTDITKCIGCLECVAACKKENNLKMDVPREWQKMDGLSAQNWTSILSLPDNHYVRKQCRHCIDPACASACPVGALHKTVEGVVIYDNDKCLGCRYCMMACPYGIPRYDWDQNVPYIRKCIMCYQRLTEGRQPACTEACPKQATIFGDREELLRLAHQRIKEQPDLYINKVWGEHEIGGTSVLYISDIDLGFLAYQPDLGPQALSRTTAPAMNAVPFAFVGMGAVMYGINWVIRRRMNIGKDGNKEGTHE